jgi:hypothetical protein
VVAVEHMYGLATWVGVEAVVVMAQAQSAVAFPLQLGP